MPDLLLLADMNISPKTVKVLQEMGWNILRVSEFLPAYASDQEVMELARQENRVVITQDLDFSALLALSGYDRPSLITLRMSISDPDTVAERLLEVLPRTEDVLLEGCVIIIHDATIRIRRLPIH